MPTLRELLALNHSQPSKAVELLQTAIPYEGGSPIKGGSEFLLGAGNLHLAYVPGLAYLATHHGAEAAADFQKILDHRGLVICDPVGLIGHDTKRAQGMVLGYSLLRAYVAEHIQLLLVFSTHTFFLSGCAVETREFPGTGPAYSRVEYASKTKKPQPDSIRIIECRLLLQTLMPPSLEAPLCQFLEDESMKSQETAFMLGMIIERKGFHD